MDCLSPRNPTKFIVFMKASQIGATECGLNWLGYIIHHSPGPTLMVQPTKEVAEKASKQRIQPMIDSTPVLRDSVKPHRERDSGNTILLKEFYGGMLIIGGANSAASLRSMPIKNLFMDEIEEYPVDVDGEGDPISLAEKRTSTFARRKIYKCSSPAEKETSKIEPEYEKSDKRQYHVPCPFCGHKQVLKWSNIIFDKDDLDAGVFYKCCNCDDLIEEHHKTFMLENGEWIAEKEFKGIAGFHLSSLYSPVGWTSWREIVEEFLDAQKDTALLKTWTNTRLAETWEMQYEKINETALYMKRKEYEEDCPSGVLVLTGGIDVQADRIELSVWGWGHLFEAWLIEHRVFRGDPSGDQVWTELRDFLLEKRYKHQYNIELHIAACCIDTGYKTNEVYAFVKPLEGRRVYAVKGSNTAGDPLVRRPSTSNIAKVSLFTIGTDTAKDALFGKIRIGQTHFPMSVDEEYFRQLTAEVLDKRMRMGRPVRFYKQVYDRNETLDCFVYSYVAVNILNPDFDVLAKKINPPDEEEKKEVEEEKKEVPVTFVKRPNQRKPKRRGGFVTGWKK